MYRSTLHAITVVFFLAACSTSDPSGGNGGNGGGSSSGSIALSQACEAFGEAVCRSYLTCGYFGVESLEFCVEELFGCDAFRLPEQVTGGQLGYDGAALRRCLGKLENAPCVDDGVADVFAVDADCRAAFRGLVPVGGECDEDLVCASGECGGSFPGHCVATGALGSSCKSDGEYCAPHLGCIAGSCGELPVAGQRCARYERCAPGLRCDESGSCRAYPVLGEACGFVDEEYIECDMRWICADGTCVARGEEGAACEDSDECRAELWCASGTCAPRTPAGGACSNGWEGDESCLAGMHCLSGGICGRLLEAGSPCDELYDDCRAWCEGGRCIEEAEPGEACDDETTYCWSGPCVDGICTDDEC